MAKNRAAQEKIANEILQVLAEKNKEADKQRADAMANMSTEDIAAMLEERRRQSDARREEQNRINLQACAEFDQRAPPMHETKAARKAAKRAEDERQSSSHRNEQIASAAVSLSKPQPPLPQPPLPQPPPVWVPKTESEWEVWEHQQDEWHQWLWGGGIVGLPAAAE